MHEFRSRVGPKGQITLPREVRRRFGIRARDIVAIRVEGELVTIIPLGSALAESFQAAPALSQPLSVEEMTGIAAEERAQEAAREGL